MSVRVVALMAVLAGVGIVAVPCASGEDREMRCRAACEPVVLRCVENLQGLFGDMRGHCERVTIDRCRREGPAECEKATRGLVSPPATPQR